VPYDHEDSFSIFVQNTELLISTENTNWAYYVQKNTKATLDKKKLRTVKKAVQENISLCKSIGVSKKVLLDLVKELYDEK
jgi:DNA-binding transcriptional regulator YhcF (GntR family)